MVKPSAKCMIFPPSHYATFWQSHMTSSNPIRKRAKREILEAVSERQRRRRIAGTWD